MAASRSGGLPLWFPLALLALLIAWPTANQVRAAAPETQLLVADLRAEELILVDVDDPAVSSRIPLPGGAHELLALPHGRVVVSIEQHGLLAVIDLATAEVTEVPVGGTPHGLALDGDVLLVTDRSVDEVRRFEIDGWRELDPVATDDWPHAVAMSSDGQLVVVAAQASTLSVGPRTFEVSELPETVSVGSDGAIATAGAIGGDLQVFTDAGSEELRVYLGGRPVRVLFSPDGTQIAVALSASGEVALVDRLGGVRRVEVRGVPDGLAFSASGDRLYVSDVVSGGVSIVDPRSARLTGVIDVGTATGAMLIR